MTPQPSGEGRVLADDTVGGVPFTIWFDREWIKTKAAIREAEKKMRSHTKEPSRGK